MSESDIIKVSSTSSELKGNKSLNDTFCTKEDRVTNVDSFGKRSSFSRKKFKRKSSQFKKKVF